MRALDQKALDQKVLDQKALDQKVQRLDGLHRSEGSGVHVSSCPTPPLQVAPVPVAGKSAVFALRAHHGPANLHQAEASSNRSPEEISHLWHIAGSEGTNTAYQSAWTRWSSGCSQRNLNPFSCGVNPFVTFLASLYEQGLQHRTVNTIRSAVFVTHDRAEGLPLGQHPRVSRIMKGIYNSRPPKPRYTVTWDVNRVVTYLSELGTAHHSQADHAYGIGTSKQILGAGCP